MMLNASMSIVLAWALSVNSLETPVAEIPLSARTSFIGGVIGCCLTQSLDADDLKWARDHGFTSSISVKTWPGHKVRSTADVVASVLPNRIKERCRKLIIRRDYSNSEMHADLLYMYGSPMFMPKHLCPWRKILAKMGPRTWELGCLFEDVSSFVENTYAPEKVLWRDEQVVDVLQEVNMISASIRKNMCPFFDHIRCVDAVFVPFLVPRSGFGIAPRGDHIIIAFGPGIDSRDHIMTIWHELLHYPIRRVMDEVLGKNRGPLRIDTGLSVLEENIVAVLTDYLCPAPRDRPEMKFDGLIRENFEKYRQIGGNLDLIKFVENVVNGAALRSHG